MYRRLGAVALLGGAALTGPVGAATAGSPPLHCGDQVSTSIVLHQDLTCTGTALYLVIPQTGTLKVNLNGHRLTGDGTGTGLETATYHPVGEISGSLEVTSGTIAGFASAVVGPATPSPGLLNLTMRRVKLTGNGSWLPTAVMQNVLVDRAVITDSGPGGARVDSQRFTLQNSALTRSSVKSNSETNNYLYGNTFLGGNFYSGYSSNVTAVGNRFRDCGDGIRIAATDTYSTRVEQNAFRHCETGVRFDGMVLGTVTVKDNVFAENTVAGMTYLNQYNQDLQIIGNSFLRNTGDGLSGAETTSGSANGGGPTLISGNVANNNGGLGINVTGVVRDGGDNFARRNGNPAQCAGVVCH